MNNANAVAHHRPDPSREHYSSAMIGMFIAGIASTIVGCAQRHDFEPGGVPPHERRPITTDTTSESSTVASAMREVFPHVRVDAVAKVVEFDGEVPIDCHNPKTPRVYLEVTACTPNSREHESLIVTRAVPSHIHAALLLIGLEPGAPGRWHVVDGTIQRTEPSGGAVDVEFVWTDASGQEHLDNPLGWIANAATLRPGDSALGRLDGFWLFAGSRMVNWQGREFYDADGTGTLIGLTTFGSETIAYSRVISPEAALEEPEWIADVSCVPAMGTRVVVRLHGADKGVP